MKTKNLISILVGFVLGAAVHFGVSFLLLDKEMSNLEPSLRSSDLCPFFLQEFGFTSAEKSKDPTLALQAALYYRYCSPNLDKQKQWLLVSSKGGNLDAARILSDDIFKE